MKTFVLLLAILISHPGFSQYNQQKKSKGLSKDQFAFYSRSTYSAPVLQTAEHKKPVEYWKSSGMPDPNNKSPLLRSPVHLPAYAKPSANQPVSFSWVLYMGYSLLSGNRFVIQNQPDGN